MKIKRISDKYTIATQIEIDKIGKLADRGFRSILCNRPDGEGADQPRFAEVEAAAARAGIRAAYVPIELSGATDRDVRAFHDAVRSLPTPLLAYCRSGTRSAMLISRL
jgi:sulfide:quinone oxidoreductase